MDERRRLAQALIDADVAGWGEFGTDSIELESSSDGNSSAGGGDRGRKEAILNCSPAAVLRCQLSPGPLFRLNHR